MRPTSQRVCDYFSESLPLRFQPRSESCCGAELTRQINFNEAVNFALPDWLADGKEAVLRYKLHAKAPVFSHNELLINITLYSETIRTALWLVIGYIVNRRANLQA